MPYNQAAAKAALRSRLDTALGAAEPTIGDATRDKIAEAISLWWGADVMATLLVSTTVTTTVAGTCSTGPVAATGTGAGTGGVS